MENLGLACHAQTGTLSHETDDKILRICINICKLFKLISFIDTINNTESTCMPNLSNVL
jgi:hypothetical protein